MSHVHADTQTQKLKHRDIHSLTTASRGREELITERVGGEGLFQGVCLLSGLSVSCKPCRLWGASVSLSDLKA